MGNFDDINSAMLMIYDELKDDKKSKKLINKIDKATTDQQIREGAKEAIARLRELGKNALADTIEQKTKAL